MKIFFLILLFVATPVFALSEEPASDIVAYIPDFVKVPDGGTPWDVFSETKEIPEAGKDDQGIDYEIKVPGFSPALKKLEGQIIVMQGYMFPLEPDEKQSEFLFGPFPVSCPFHYHVGPSMVIEVHAAKPIKFSYDPIDIQGRLELVPKDIETETFYRLRDAVIVD